VNFSRFRAATRISRVNCAEMAGDRPRRPAYEIFNTECSLDFSNPSPDPLVSRRPAHAGVKKGYPSKSGYRVFIRCWFD